MRHRVQLRLSLIPLAADAELKDFPLTVAVTVSISVTTQRLSVIVQRSNAVCVTGTAS